MSFLQSPLHPLTDLAKRSKPSRAKRHTLDTEALNLNKMDHIQWFAFGGNSNLTAYSAIWANWLQHGPPAQWADHRSKTPVSLDSISGRPNMTCSICSAMSIALSNE